MQTAIQSTYRTSTLAFLSLLPVKTAKRPAADQPTHDQPTAEQRALWAAWAALPRGLGEGERIAAEQGFRARAGERARLRPVLAEMLRGGLTDAACRRASRAGVDLLGASALPPAAFATFLNALQDLGYEYPAASDERYIVRSLAWCVNNVRAKRAKARAKKERTPAPR